MKSKLEVELENTYFLEEIKKKLHYIATNCYLFLKDGTVIENYL